VGHLVASVWSRAFGCSAFGRRAFGRVVIWTRGHLVACSSGHIVMVAGHLVAGPFGREVLWSWVHLVAGHLVVCHLVAGHLVALNEKSILTYIQK
jgi:hypothetical protein